MSRSALWRQEVNVKERERIAAETFEAAIEEGRTNSYGKGIIALHGPDDTFNMNPMLLSNISKSAYFQKCCVKIKDWNSLVDEIYYKVTHVEPWTPGATKMPSTAFCLLVRLLTLRCTEKQMGLMLEHVDSPYIRCVGFLYLRYAGDPERLWEWFEPYLYDEEPVQVFATGTKPESTIGEWVRSLLTEMNYHGTLLPRLPVQTERNVKVHLLQAEQNEERAKRHLHGNILDCLLPGAKVRALYADNWNPTAWYDAVIDKVISEDVESGQPLARPKFQVTFPEYGNTELVTLGQIDLRPTQHEHYSERRSVASVTRNASDPSRGYQPRASSDHHHHRPYTRESKQHTPAAQPDTNQHKLMEEVLRREREKSAAKGRAYASRPACFKLSLSAHTDTTASSSAAAAASSSSHRASKKRSYQEKQHAPDSNTAPTTSGPRQKTPEELAAIQEKKRKLMQRYG